MITLLLLVRATYIYGVVLHAHPVRGESHNQRNTTGEVATVASMTTVTDPGGGCGQFHSHPELRAAPLNGARFICKCDHFWCS